MYLVSAWPIDRRSAIRARKTSLWTPSLVQMRSGSALEAKHSQTRLMYDKVLSCNSDGLDVWVWAGEVIVVKWLLQGWYDAYAPLVVLDALWWFCCYLRLMRTSVCWFLMKICGTAEQALTDQLKITAKVSEFNLVIHNEILDQLIDGIDNLWQCFQ